MSRTRPIDVNSGDQIKKTYGSRFVAEECRQEEGSMCKENVFAGTPLLEALHLLVSTRATYGCDSHKQGLKNIPVADVLRVS